MISGHGNDTYNFDTQIEVDFSSNIAFNNLSRQIIGYIGGRLTDIENYPDPMCRELSRKIANHHNVPPRRVGVCNGSAEAFYMVAHFIERRAEGRAARSLVFVPSFAEYEDSCRLYGHAIEFGNLIDFTNLDYSDFDSVWLGTPNNPDGYRVSIEEIERVARRFPDTLFVVDRAYNTLSSSCDSDSVATSPNIILIHSLTKPFGIPGLRLGYIVAQEGPIERLSELRPPWSVNALSMAAGEYIMDNYDALQLNLEELLTESRALQYQLSAIEGLKVTPSDVNFFVCRIEDGRKGGDLLRYLVDNHRLLIRDCSNFRGLSESHFRVATQSAEHNKILIEALQRWI
ncbi:MAG: aminotransferase class I/II-fold pyridoxal phosphate-dependent enzyme [Rikenellaceae bacterium]